jgi:hypothetical protein
MYRYHLAYDKQRRHSMARYCMASGAKLRKEVRADGVEVAAERMDYCGMGYGKSTVDRIQSTNTYRRQHPV